MTQYQPAPDRQRGMALVTALLLLIVVTIMALSMFRSYGTQERIAGNTRDKQRALNAAVSAQQYAESLLLSSSLPPTGGCTGIVPSTTGQVCSPNPLFNPITVPWAIGVTYTPFTSNSVNGVKNVLHGATNGLTATADAYSTGTNPILTASASYYDVPYFYVTDLGPNKDPTAPGEVYQIDALGYGGTANTVAVVESTYLISTNSAHGGDK
jgi:type IV pilus assembly protein PilX